MTQQQFNTAKQIMNQIEYLTKGIVAVKSSEEHYHINYSYLTFPQGNIDELNKQKLNKIKDNVNKKYDEFKIYLEKQLKKELRICKKMLLEI